ncbi:hypothetical protein BKA56DRAFT_701691 [Ilyonectria sp. MPI-CAGE-AT-0026]|nr:hypothetical protein BKA56DRAFT_701691 [Ilyonectria sp. MPI-CAGE-AT-0026]
MEPFVHVPEYPFIICKPCAAAFVADEVISHLQARHAVGSMAQQIHNIIQAIPGIIHNQRELQQWSVPPPTTAPIPFIPPPRHDGFGCEQCPYVARQIQRIQQHCRDKHGWANARKRGRHTKAFEATIPPVPWRTGVQCQRFFRTRVASSWFEVGRSIPSSNEGPEPDLGIIHRRFCQNRPYKWDFLARALPQYRLLLGRVADWLKFGVRVTWV